MLSYIDFKNRVVAEILNYFPEEYRGTEVIVRKVNKVNEQLDGLTLKRGNVSPTVYIQDMYESYQAGWTFDEIMQNIAEQYVQADKEYAKNFAGFDAHSIRNNIEYELINAETNAEMLKNVPHRIIFDMALIYRWVLDRNPDMMQSVVVTNKIAENNDLSEEELYQLASANALKTNPPLIICMEDIIGQYIENNVEGQPKILVITNATMMNGAVAILNKEILKAASTRLNGDIYLIPSSIHEFLAINADHFDLGEAKEMVADINANKDIIADRDVLTNSVYLYRVETDEFTKAA